MPAMLRPSKKAQRIFDSLMGKKRRTPKRKKQQAEPVSYQENQVSY